MEIKYRNYLLKLSNKFYIYIYGCNNNKINIKNRKVRRNCF